jgi:diguanylate cyclase (GGDEF)-like protein
MRSDNYKAFVNAFKAKHAEHESRRALTLLAIQAVLLVLLCATIILVLLVDIGERSVFYMVLVAGLALLLILSVVLNFKGWYKPAAWLVVLTTVIGPWLCVLLDSTIANGDFVPLIYMALSIQLCAVLLSERVTVAIGLLQFAGLTALVIVCPALGSLNWPSLMAFIVFFGTMGVLTSLHNRRYVEQIEKHRNMLQQNEVKMHELAVRDSLTGLFNRRYMEETLEREINRAIRTRRCLGVIMADVDGFKMINDTYGHALGDAVLTRVADELRLNVRKSDVACRFGGDEFLLILPECTLEDAVLRAQALRRVIEAAPFELGRTDIGSVTMSLGVAALPEHGSSGEELLKAADKALYTAKKGGRNRVVTARVPRKKTAAKPPANDWPPVP